MITLRFPIETFYIAILIYGITLLCYLLKLKQLSILSLVTAFVVNMISEVSGRYLIWPYCNMFSEPFFLPLCLAGICLILIIPKRDEQALSMVFMIVLFSCMAVFFSEGYYPPFTLMSKSIYAHLFHLFVFIAHGLLIAGAYLAIHSVFKKKRDEAPYQMIIWGFAFLCTAGLFGMVWSYLGRSDVISWNHYYFHSIAIWFYYVGFLHLHLIKGWDQRRKAWILLGGAFLIFSFDYLPQIGGIHIPEVLNARLYELY
ncbi:MAG: hypothetical protein JRI71_09315 [Deltaproteobacteria bacterium]|nr:hypothetical protein [Deltaproteobacteria bacterium]MBW2077726.1 hypothetical protein [Deltaproteobacteria bacterium]